MALSLNIGKCTLLGNYRENNEDAIEVKQFPDLTVSVVADGMGGQAAGEVASRRAIEVIPREIRRQIPTVQTHDQVKQVIRESIVRANKEIMEMGALDREMRNMGTTVVVAVWRRGNEMYIAGVGDSRAYLIRDKTISQLTIDHSLAQALVEAKTISEEEAKGHRFSNVLWKYLGTKEVGEGPDVTAISIHPGDQFLLCTDGLSGVVEDEKLLEFVLGQDNVQDCADGLGQLALDAGSRDNVSVIMVEVVEG